MGMEPAGEMWSVVTESPSSARVHHVVEVGRFLDVSGGLVPLVDAAGGNRQALPVLVAIEDVGVFVLEHAAVDGGAHGGGDLFIGGPDVAQEYGLAGGVMAEGIGGQVDIHGAGQGIGHDEGRRSQMAEGPPAFVEFWETKPHSSIHPWTRVSRNNNMYESAEGMP